jgi:hypothetical protein
MTMKLIVTSIAPEGGSIAIGVGLDDHGAEHYFACEYRMGAGIAEAIDAGEEPQVDVEAWQLLGGAS